MLHDSALDEARALDDIDPLSGFRHRFALPGAHIYLDGNSLGLACREAESALLAAIDGWKRHGIGGWTAQGCCWYTLAESLGAQLAELMGAEAEEVVVTNSTTVNLHQLLASLFIPSGGRNRLLMDAEAFPSDLYAAKSFLRSRNLDPSHHLVEVRPGPSGFLEEDDIVLAMDETVHTALLSSVTYARGQLLDMQWLSRAAHERGLLIGFDCSHSAGVVSHNLHDWGVDFAFWCTYKYLNGGPGSSGGLFLHNRHFGAAAALAGWFGSSKSRQFEMSSAFHQERGAAGLQIGTPNIFSMAPLFGSLSVIAEATIPAIRAKSLSLTGLLINQADASLAGFGLEVASPRQVPQRGGHVSLRHPEAARICKALRAAGVIPDYRPPDLVRLGPAPLYNSHQDCANAISRLRDIMERRAYNEFGSEREIVP